MRRVHSLLAACFLVAPFGCKTAEDPKASGVDGKAVESPETAVDPAPESEAATPSKTPPPSDPGATSGPPTQPGSESGDGIPATAAGLCKYIVEPDEETEILDCEFLAGGRDLGAGRRFELLRIRFSEGGVDELDQIHAVLRSVEEVHSEVLAESTEVPGETVEGTVGKVKLADGRLVISSRETVTTYPNTGDPDADADEQVEITEYSTTCVVEDLSCERESVEP